MPFFDFKCVVCDAVHEAFLLRHDMDPPPCPACNAPTRRIFSFRTKGRCLVGADCHDVNSDRYNHPDKPNGARMWYQFANKCEKAEDAGKTPVIPGDNVHLSIKAFQKAGYDL